MPMRSPWKGVGLRDFRKKGLPGRTRAGRRRRGIPGSVFLDERGPSPADLRTWKGLHDNGASSLARPPNERERT